MIGAARLAAIISADIARKRSVIVQAGGELARVGSPRCAARWAHLWGRSLDEAAREFGCGIGAVLTEWFTLYRGEPTDPAQRGGR